MAKLSRGGDMDDLDEQQKTRNAALLTHRRILMRLNMTESLHQRLEKALEPLLFVRATTVNQEELTEAVSLARQVLKHEWEVTKYGMFTTPVVCFKRCWKWLSAWRKVGVARDTSTTQPGRNGLGYCCVAERQGGVCPRSTRKYARVSQN
jgi:hypothetical protein